MYARTRFKVIAILFAGAAVFHAIGLLAPEWAPAESRWRHACYTLLDFTNAFFILSRPTWQVALLWAITAEQFHSHGVTAYEVWWRDGRIDWLSLAVLGVMTCVLFVTTSDWARRRA